MSRLLALLPLPIKCFYWFANVFVTLSLLPVGNIEDPGAAVAVVAADAAAVAGYASFPVPATRRHDSGVLFVQFSLCAVDDCAGHR